MGLCQLYDLMSDTELVWKWVVFISMENLNGKTENLCLKIQSFWWENQNKICLSCNLAAAYLSIPLWVRLLGQTACPMMHHGLSSCELPQCIMGVLWPQCIVEDVIQTRSLYWQYYMFQVQSKYNTMNVAVTLIFPAQGNQQGLNGDHCIFENGYKP